jgi:Radical SAM superfamily
MSQRKLNLVQVNFSQGIRELNAYYLPYSAGVLWSYACTIPAIADNWQLGTLAWRRDPIESVVKQLADCDVIGFSNYIWNKSYNYALARAIKQYNPSCLTVFGGPETPVERADLFQLHPYIDRVVKQEGEMVLANLLLDPGAEIAGLLINDRGQVRDTGSAGRISDLSVVPSPYTSGVFDALVQQHPEVTWNATLETNRGCPYQCTFCDWGSLTYNKVKRFDLQRVFDDISWMGRNRCDFMSIADANFGMFVERDEAIVEHLLTVQDRYGYPRRMGVSWAKNQRVEVARLAKKLTSRGFNNGLTLSVQSLDDHVLDQIKRRNLEINRLEEVFEICAREGLTVNTELILGLPGETLHSWQRSVWRLLEINQHNGLEFFQAQLLENAEMNLSQRDAHAMTSITVYDYMSGSPEDDGIPEGIEVVTSTCDLPMADMLACQEFAWFINTWHVNGPSQWYSRFLRKACGVSYEEFYKGFMQHLQNSDWWCEERRLVIDAYDSWMHTGSISVAPVAGVAIHGWNLIHVTYLRMQASGTFGQFHAAVRTYVDMYYGDKLMNLPVDARFYNDLRKVTEAYVVRHDTMERYPMKVSLDSNLMDFLLHDEDLRTSSDAEHVRFEFPEDKQQSLSVFMQNVYFARRRNFGKARVVLAR